MFTMHNADKELPTLQDFYLDTLQFYVDLTARGCLKVKKLHAWNKKFQQSTELKNLQKCWLRFSSNFTKNTNTPEGQHSFTSEAFKLNYLVAFSGRCLQQSVKLANAKLAAICKTDIKREIKIFLSFVMFQVLIKLCGFVTPVKTFVFS